MLFPSYQEMLSDATLVEASEFTIITNLQVKLGPGSRMAIAAGVAWRPLCMKDGLFLNLSNGFNSQNVPLSNSST